MLIVLSVVHIAVFGVAYFWGERPHAVGTPRRADDQLLRVAVHRERTLSFYAVALCADHAFAYFARFRHLALVAAQTKSRAARLQLNLAEARIHALRMELNSHFLFNTLNAVSPVSFGNAGRRRRGHARATRRSAADERSTARCRLSLG